MPVKIEIDGQSRVLTDIFVLTLQQQVVEMEIDIKRHSQQIGSLSEWCEMCRNFGVSRLEIEKQFDIFAKDELAGQLGSAWFWQIYLPEKQKKLEGQQ